MKLLAIVAGLFVALVFAVWAGSVVGWRIGVRLRRRWPR